MPDFRNLGVIARILIAVNAAALLAALVRSREFAEFPAQVAEIAPGVEIVLLVNLLALYALARPLARLGYRPGLAAVFLIVLAVTVALQPLERMLGSGRDAVWGALYALLIAAALAAYFRLRSRAFSPALAEARLQALQARIRPHFLFNSLTATLALVRSDPARAETALEDLAELFRTAMADPRRMVPLGEEVALARRYLALEQIRLGERLRVVWRVDPHAEAALVPSLLLQPLVENAVYHGVEPGIATGLIEIELRRAGDWLHLRLSNPYHEEHQHRQGNRMALENLRERLALHFDAAASLATRLADGRYEIEIRLPYRSAP